MWNAWFWLIRHNIPIYLWIMTVAHGSALYVGITKLIYLEDTTNIFTICTNQALSSRWQIVKTCKVWLTLSKTRSGLPVCGFACFDGLIMSLLTWLCKRKYLKGYSTPKQKFCHKSLTPSCRSKPIKALFVFGTQCKIFWMKTAVCDCPIDCQVNDTNVKAQKSMKSIARIVHLTSVVQSEFN